VGDVLPVPGRVQSRINIANGPTDTTPLRQSGHPVSAGFDHVVDGHFDVPVGKNRSVFTVTPEELKVILQSDTVVSSPVTSVGDGTFVRTANAGRPIGTTSLNEGGVPTSTIKVFTDSAGNLITAYPVSGGK
jgi:filamentous hemagglutinin